MKRKLHTLSLKTHILRYGIILSIALIIFNLASNSIYAVSSNTANISLSPSQISLIGNTPETNTIELDSGPETIGFAHVELIFNPDVIQLATEIMPSPLFDTVITKTSMTEANKTGVIDITLGVSPQNFSNAPSGKINLALLDWVTNTNPSNQISSIAFTTGASQVVSTNTVSLDVLTTDGVILINNPTPSPTASPILTANPTFTPLPTSTPISTPTDSPIPTEVPTNTPSPTSTPISDNFVYGLIGRYYNGKNFNNFVFKRIDPKINFNWRMGSAGNGVHTNKFSIRWTGYFKPEKSGKYIFYTKSDDGVKLWLNNKLIIDDWKDHGLHERSKEINLEAGNAYPIKMEYYENTGLAQIQLYFSGPDINKTTIPSDLFIP